MVIIVIFGGISELLVTKKPTPRRGWANQMKGGTRDVFNISNIVKYIPEVKF